jgi:glutathione S-transferase
MKQYPIYKNPYEQIKLDSNTDFKLHVVGLGNSDLSSLFSSFSPYAAKLEAYLRLFKIPHEIVIEPVPDVGPRGKVPFVSVGDTKLADSELVISYLKKTYADPDAGLTAAQRAVGHLVQRTLEDHFYWIIVYYEFFDQKGWDFILKAIAGDPSALPIEIQNALAERREDFRKRCFDQGVARYTPEEIVEKACKDLNAISQILGNHRYLLGTDQPTSFDAVLFGFTLVIFQARGMHPEVTDYARKIPNFVRYIQNMLTTYYPELKLAFQPT